MQKQLAWKIINHGNQRSRLEIRSILLNMSDAQNKMRLPQKFIEQQKLAKIEMAHFQEIQDQEETEDSEPLSEATIQSVDQDPYPTNQSINFESRMHEMKLQLASSHAMFLQAHHELQSLSFEQMQFDVGPPNAASWDDQELEDILTNAAKDFQKDEGFKKAPEFHEFMNIISTLQEGIKTLEQNQNLMSDLGKEVKNEIQDMRAKSSSYWEGGMVSRKVTEEADVYKEMQTAQSLSEATDSDSD